MSEYYYHGSPLELSEIHEARPGEGIYLTPSRALAGMYGALRNVKDKHKGYGAHWRTDLEDGFDQSDDDTPRGFNAWSNIHDMPDYQGEAEVYIHKILLKNRLLKKLKQIRNSPMSHKVRYLGESLPVESVEKVTIPYSAHYDDSLEREFGPAVKLASLKIWKISPEEYLNYLEEEGMA